MVASGGSHPGGSQTTTSKPFCQPEKLPILGQRHRLDHSQEASKKFGPGQANHIRTWNQAAIRYKEGANTKPCPLCQVPATPKHIIWMRKWHHKQKHPPMPAMVGKAARPFGRALMGPRLDSSRATRPPHHSADPRAQAWIYALCIHGYSLGAPQRKGTITGMARRSQSKARAIFQALLTLAQFIQTPTRVVVQLSLVWEAWTNPGKRKGFHDLAQGQPAEYYTLITPLYIHKNHKTPEAPGNEPHLRQR